MNIELLIILIFGVIASATYKVAVIEYQREVYNGFEANIKHNLDNYLKIIDNIVNETQKLDLIVFPEGTLVFQPSYTKEELLKHAARLPIDNATIPCLETAETTSSYVQKLSCSSKTHNVYISVNIIEKTDSGELFNANIVFDRQGRLVSKYRKMYPLAGEKFISSGNTVEYFQTDFGVTFGVFICFDIFFKNAYIDAFDDNVDAFIFPSYWYSELPYLSSTQMQKMWASLHGKTLLASGGNNGITGTSGSGIYSGSYSYSSYLSGTTNTKVLIANLTKSSESKQNKKHKTQSNHSRDLNNFNFITKRPEMIKYPLNQNDAHKDIEETLCHNEFCCHFKVNVNYTSGLVFSIYNGLQPFIGFGKLGIQLCAVLQCEDTNCFKMPSDEYYQKNFKVLEVQVVNATVGADYYPNIALKNLFFMPTENYSWTGTNLHLKLSQETAGIYTFGFYGRNYKIDEIQ